MNLGDRRGVERTADVQVEPVESRDAGSQNKLVDRGRNATERLSIGLKPRDQVGRPAPFNRVQIRSDNPVNWTQFERRAFDATR